MTVIADVSRAEVKVSDRPAKRGMLNIFVDFLADLDVTLDPETRTKARGLVWFSLVAGLLLPVLLDFDRRGNDLSLFLFQLYAGAWFVMTAIMVLRITRSTSLTGIWIGA